MPLFRAHLLESTFPEHPKLCLGTTCKHITGECFSQRISQWLKCVFNNLVLNKWLKLKYLCMDGNVKILLRQGRSPVHPLMCGNSHAGITVVPVIPWDSLYLRTLPALVLFVWRKRTQSDYFTMFNSEYLQTLWDWCPWSADALGPSPFIPKGYLLARDVKLW